MKVKLIEGARAALDAKHSEMVLLYSEAERLEPVALVVDGLEFDCLAGNMGDDPDEVWAVDCSGYWMRAENLGSGTLGALEEALKKHLARMAGEREETVAFDRLNDRALAALCPVPAFPSLRG